MAHDLIVIGGGIHGVMTAWIAAERGYDVCLLEKDQLGGGASGGWFGILHGGLRYLQGMDLRRYRQSVIERRWFMRTFPEHITLQPFLMPLYGQGLKRPEIFRAAFAADAALSVDRGTGVAQELQLPRGRVISNAVVLEHASCVLVEGLEGGALWSEAVVPDMNALFAAIAARTSAAGAILRDGTAVAAPLVQDGRIAGVTLEDGEEIRAPKVINAGGGAADGLAMRLDPDYRAEGGSALAFNLMLDRPPPSECGLALYGGAGTEALFLYPSGERTFAGTWYLPWTDGSGTEVPEDAVRAMLDAVDERTRGLGLRIEQVQPVRGGLLPVTRAGTTQLCGADRFVDHAAHGGPSGLYTVRGVKFTTAPAAARKALALAGM
ncbi:FAD-dependent oxidoreductase [Aestuariibius insulae]|uniref:FAD-dependent oxidoreductase n=1 Tax=Aestuariibius insulae TaxID=2058287 RepID=UPI00345E9BA5